MPLSVNFFPLTSWAKNSVPVTVGFEPFPKCTWGRNFHHVQFKNVLGFISSMSRQRWSSRISRSISMGSRAAQLVELSMTAGYPWKLSMSAYLQNFATKNAVFTHFRDKNAVFTHFCDKNAVFTHFWVKNLWFHRYVTICLTRASTYTFRSCFVIILSPQVRA